MTPALELLALAVVCGLAGAGVAVLNQALPTGQLTFKPFACRTCMSGWGSIAAATSVTGHDLTLDRFALWLLLALAGTGVAHLILGLADGPPPPFPPFDDEPQDS